MHCHRFRPLPKSRREFLQQAAHGFGVTALTSLLAGWTQADTVPPAAGSGASSGGVASQKSTAPHFAAKARHVIFLYMDGGPSQVDTFDPKPMLDKYDGRNPSEIFKVEPTQFNNVGKVLKSPWKFQQYGECGLPVSELFPHIAKKADELAVIRSMTVPFSEHTFANYFLHTCHGQQGRPSHGAWVNYGLGSECENLPGFVVLNGGLIPPGGMDCFNSGFLPAAFQASIFKSGAAPVANVAPTEKSRDLQQAKLALMRQLDQSLLERNGPAGPVEAAIANYELAAKMQTAVPELMDLSGESKATQDLYGLNDEFGNTKIFAQSCLVARRLVERGVRFIELTCPTGNGDRWDQHQDLVDGHTKNARTVDRPIAGLLTDLRARGLLDSTLVVWCGEFGRTPFAQGSNGRDHNPFGFTVWMAGGGAKGGKIFGSTDEFGYHAVENKVEMYDLHATILHLLGVDHTRLTYRWGGRDMRLTDVHGHVIHDVIA